MTAAIYAATRALAQTQGKGVPRSAGRYRVLQARNYARRVPRPQSQPKQSRFSRSAKVMVGVGVPLLSLGGGFAVDRWMFGGTAFAQISRVSELFTTSTADDYLKQLSDFFKGMDPVWKEELESNRVKMPTEPEEDRDDLDARLRDCYLERARRIFKKRNDRYPDFNAWVRDEMCEGLERAGVDVAALDPEGKMSVGEVEKEIEAARKDYLIGKARKIFSQEFDPDDLDNAIIHPRFNEGYTGVVETLRKAGVGATVLDPSGTKSDKEMEASAKAHDTEFCTKAARFYFKHACVAMTIWPSNSSTLSYAKCSHMTYEQYKEYETKDPAYFYYIESIRIVKEFLRVGELSPTILGIEGMDSDEEIYKELDRMDNIIRAKEHFRCFKAYKAPKYYQNMLYCLRKSGQGYVAMGLWRDYESALEEIRSIIEESETPSKDFHFKNIPVQLREPHIRYRKKTVRERRHCIERIKFYSALTEGMK